MEQLLAMLAGLGGGGGQGRGGGIGNKTDNSVFGGDFSNSSGNFAINNRQKKRDPIESVIGGGGGLGQIGQLINIFKSFI
jgi:hypothetical protein